MQQMPTTETMRDNPTAEENKRYEVKVDIPQLLPYQPLAGDEETSNRSKAEETSKRYDEIYKAALNGDWGKADEIFKSYRDDAQAALSEKGDTALHVAAAAGRKDFVQELMSKYMKETDLVKKNKEENTAFSIAVISGNTELVEMMLKKNKKLTMIRKSGTLPVQMAAFLGNEEMVKNLYKATEWNLIESNCSTKDDHHLTEDDLVELLVRLIDSDLYDVALSMVEEFPQLAVLRAKHKNDETALHALVQRPLTNSYQGILKTFYHRVLGTNMVENKMNPKALNLVKILWKEVVSRLGYSETSKLIEKPFRAHLAAATEGNFEFLSILIDEHPDLLSEVNKKGHTILHLAVLYRQKDIFKLIDKNSSISIKNVIVASTVDQEKNNILHLAANLPHDPNRLKVVPGAALQMQRELMWFKEVEKLMPRSHAGDENKQGKTAHALFTESHKNLVKEGEEWMRKTAESCMIVATLIATVVFAATFTVPGGIKDDTGAPNFLKKASFMIFIISDTISLVSSSCSILAFLSILTARYAEEDFLWRLPFKLLLGLSTLFISVITMMIVFCTTLFIVFNEGTKWPAILAVGLAFVPVIMFLSLQIPLLSDVIGLMCSSKSFLKKKKML